jgi:hypothetical protein
MRELLAIENTTTLAQVATWADDIRAQRRETARWHFVDIPIHPPAGTPAAYDAARDCPRSDCIVAAIERFEGVLRDRSAPPRERLERSSSSCISSLTSTSRFTAPMTATAAATTSA